MGMGAGLLPGDESGKVTVGKVVNHELDANGNYVLNPEGNTYEESMGITSEDLVTSPGSSSGN
jgi:hypothetical protein